MTTLSQRQYYRKAIRSSGCRKRTRNICQRMSSCRLTKSGKRVSYCRKRGNTRRNKSVRRNSSSASRKRHRAKTNIYENLSGSSS